MVERSRGGVAHPRVSGENAIQTAAAAAWEGSSPRERGKPLETETLIDLARLIPA